MYRYSTEYYLPYGAYPTRPSRPGTESVDAASAETINKSETVWISTDPLVIEAAQVRLLFATTKDEPTTSQPSWSDAWIDSLAQKHC